MFRKPILTLLLAAAVGLVACGGSSGEAGSVDCPEGTTQQESVGGLADGDALDTRDDAIHAELEHLGATASADAVAAAIIASVPASEGVEQIELDTSAGVITMMLAPQMPGWKVERSTMCTPSEG